MLGPDLRIARIAERQHAVVTRRQALGCGLSEEETDGRLARGRLIRVHCSVYRLPGAPLSFEGRVLATVFAGGDGAVASHTTAAKLFGFEGISLPEMHITVPRSRRVRIPGVTVHQSTNGWGRTKVGRIPVTTPLRTLIDLAPLVSAPLVEDALDDVWRRGIVSIKSCLAALDRPYGRRGTKHLRKLLLERVGTRPSGSGRENATRRALIAGGLPPPVRQFVVRDDRGVKLARPDLAYPEQRIAIEFDSTKWHASKESLARDHARLNRLQAAGWLVFLADDKQLADPDELVSNVRRAFAVRRTGNRRLAERKRPPRSGALS